LFFIKIDGVNRKKPINAQITLQRYAFPAKELTQMAELMEESVEKDIPIVVGYAAELYKIR